MDLHANAVLTVRQRQRVCDLVAAGVTITAAALVVGCSRQTASKWVNRRRRGESLLDRSSRPQRSPRRTRDERRAGDPARSRGAARRTARDRLGARDRGLDRARGPAPARPLAARRAGAARGGRPLRALAPGELVHVDLRSSGGSSSPSPRHRGSLRAGARARPAGSTCSSRSTTTLGSALRRFYPNETADSSTAFLDELVRFYGSYGIPVERVLTDNGACFKRRWAEACAAHGSSSRRRVPTARRPTARPSASSAPSSSAGPTPIRTNTSQSVWPR